MRNNMNTPIKKRFISLIGALLMLSMLILPGCQKIDTNAGKTASAESQSSSKAENTSASDSKEELSYYSYTVENLKTSYKNRISDEIIDKLISEQTNALGDTPTHDEVLKGLMYISDRLIYALNYRSEGSLCARTAPGYKNLSTVLFDEFRYFTTEADLKSSVSLNIKEIPESEYNKNRQKNYDAIRQAIENDLLPKIQ